MNANEQINPEEAFAIALHVTDAGRLVQLATVYERDAPAACAIMPAIRREFAACCWQELAARENRAEPVKDFVLPIAPAEQYAQAGQLAYGMAQIFRHDYPGASDVFILHMILAKLLFDAYEMMKKIESEPAN